MRIEKLRAILTYIKFLFVKCSVLDKNFILINYT